MTGSWRLQCIELIRRKRTYKGEIIISSFLVIVFFFFFAKNKVKNLTTSHNLVIVLRTKQYACIIF